MTPRRLKNLRYALCFAIACMAAPGRAGAQDADRFCQEGWEALRDDKNMLAVVNLTFCIDEGGATLAAADLSRAHQLRGIAQRKQGFVALAFRDFDEALRIDPENPQALYQRADLHARTGDPEAAIRDYGEALRLEPAFVMALNNRCRLYGKMRRAEEALRDCNEALHLAPDNPAFLDSRALAHWVNGEKDKARQDLERARTLDPAFPGWRERFRYYEGMF